jgi:multiple sugar transport system substrate-binding protein
MNKTDFCVRVVAAVCLVSGLTGCPQGPVMTADAGPPRPPPSTEVNFLPSYRATLKPAIEASLPEFTMKTGIKVNLLYMDAGYTLAQELQLLQDRATAGDTEADLVMGIGTWTADLVNSGYVQALDPFIEESKDDPELALNDISDAMRRKDSWGGKTFGFLVDNDNQIMFYRKDVLGSPTWQAAFKAANGGMDLPNPPRSFDELLAVAKFFIDKDWDGDGVADNQWPIGVQMKNFEISNFQNTMPWVAPYAVVPTDAGAPAPGILFFKPDMTPLVNTEGIIEGLVRWREIQAYARPQPVTASCVNTWQTDGGTPPLPDGGTCNFLSPNDQFLRSKVLITMNFGDIGPTSHGSALYDPIKDKIGYARTPGSNKYFNWVTNTWVNTSSNYQVGTHPSLGWSYFINANGKHSDAAWKLLKFLASPAVSSAHVARQGSGYQPWRISHSTDTTNWLKAGWKEEDAKGYVNAILDTTNDPNAVFDLRMPGGTDYHTAMSNSLKEILTGPQPDGGVGARTAAEIKVVMDKCAIELDKITANRGKEGQVSAYKSHLGIKE